MKIQELRDLKDTLEDFEKVIDKELIGWKIDRVSLNNFQKGEVSITLKKS